MRAGPKKDSLFFLKYFRPARAENTIKCLLLRNKRQKRVI